MPQTVSEKIYQAFLANLAHVEGVRLETVESLKTLHQTGRLADKKHLARLVQEMESRHAQDQNADR